jgi:tripartite-type tricarboxylate transporter receptor subunit TctC
VALGAVVGALALAAGTAQAADPYAGKQIRMVIGSGAGGGYDAYARALAQFMADHIPGKPTIVSQNMPGASGMAATNWGYNVAPKDGSVIISTYNALLLEPLFGSSPTEYDSTKYNWIGSIGRQQNICMVWHTSPIKTIDQAKEREITVAATGATGNSATLPRIINAMLGTKFKTVIGYSTTESRLAVERGEAEGICGLSLSTLKASNPDWVKNNRMNVLVQTGAKPQPELPNVPTLESLVKNEDDKQVLRLLSIPEDIGRPFAMPPGTPAELVTIIRRAFDATMADKTFRTEAEKRLLEVDPLTGEEVQKLIQAGYATPKPLIERAAVFLRAEDDSGKGKKK